MAVATIADSAGVVKYTFYNIDGLPSWNIKSDGITVQTIPAMLDPYVYDATSRNEEFAFEFTLIPTNYAGPGTGTFMDQLADLFYVYRNQGAIIKAGLSGHPFLIFTIVFASSAGVNAGHDADTIDPDSKGNITGFATGYATYQMYCVIKDLTMVSIDPMQRHVKYRVTLLRVKTVIAYG